MLERRFLPEREKTLVFVRGQKKEKLSLGIMMGGGFGVQPAEAQPLSLDITLEGRPEKGSRYSVMLWEFP